MRIKEPMTYWEIVDVELGHVFITYEKDQIPYYQKSIEAMGHRFLTKEVIPS
jgi:hypothetical protein